MVAYTDPIWWPILATVVASIVIGCVWVYYTGERRHPITRSEPLTWDTASRCRLCDDIDKHDDWRLFQAPEFTDYLPTIYDDLVVSEAMAELDIELPSVLDGKWGAA